MQTFLFRSTAMKATRKVGWQPEKHEGEESIFFT
jgi:hypothetical protein